MQARAATLRSRKSALRVELRLCRVGVDCSEKWVIYEKANPEAGIRCTSHEQATDALAAAKRSYATAGVQLLSAPSSGLSVLHNGFTIPQSVMKEQGFDFSVDVVWEWHPIPDDSDVYGEWRLLAKAAGRGPVELTGRSSTTGVQAGRFMPL